LHITAKLSLGFSANVRNGLFKANLKQGCVNSAGGGAVFTALAVRMPAFTLEDKWSVSN
jgi:hypothetical protein